MILKVKKLSDKAILPTYGSKEAAGMDLYAAENKFIHAGYAEKVRTGISIEIPSGNVGLIFARSGLATKYTVRPANCVGVIDADYRGEIMVPLICDSNIGYTVMTGERIAQMVIMPYEQMEIEEAEELNETQRGARGFGSTGK